VATCPEKIIENEILCWLQFFPHVFAWKNNTTGIYDPKKEKFRKLKGFNITGASDILGIVGQKGGGKMMAIEVKTPESIKRWRRLNDTTFQPTSKNYKDFKRAKDQWDFLVKIKTAGGIGGVVSSLDEAKEILEEWL